MVKSDVFTIKEIWKWHQTMFSRSSFCHIFYFYLFSELQNVCFYQNVWYFCYCFIFVLAENENNFIIFFCYQMSRRILLIFFLGILLDTDKFKNTLCHLLTKRENEDDNSFTIFCYLCLLFVEVPTCISLG